MKRILLTVLILTGIVLSGALDNALAWTAAGFASGSGAEKEDFNHAR